jgi:hypothetical protein
MATRATRPAAQPSLDETALHSEAPPNPAGRDAKGRFTAGNRGGPGNPFARRAAELRSAFLAAATPEDMQRICQRLITMAALGDLVAAKLVLGYLLGKVPEPVNPDTLDLEECRQAAQNPTCAEVQQVMRYRPAADLSATILRAQDILNEEQLHQFAQKLKEEPEATAAQDGEGLEEERYDEELAIAEEPADSAESMPLVTKRPQRRASGDKASVGMHRPSPNGGHGREHAANEAPAAAPPSPNGSHGPRQRPAPRR